MFGRVFTQPPAIAVGHASSPMFRFLPDNSHTNCDCSQSSMIDCWWGADSEGCLSSQDWTHGPLLRDMKWCCRTFAAVSALSTGFVVQRLLQFMSADRTLLPPSGQFSKFYLVQFSTINTYNQSRGLCRTVAGESGTLFLMLPRSASQTAYADEPSVSVFSGPPSHLASPEILFNSRTFRSRERRISLASDSAIASEVFISWIENRKKSVDPFLSAPSFFV